MASDAQTQNRPSKRKRATCPEAGLRRLPVESETGMEVDLLRVREAPGADTAPHTKIAASIFPILEMTNSPARPKT